MEPFSWRNRLTSQPLARVRFKLQRFLWSILIEFMHQIASVWWLKPFAVLSSNLLIFTWSNLQSFLELPTSRPHLMTTLFRSAGRLLLSLSAGMWLTGPTMEVNTTGRRANTLMPRCLVGSRMVNWWQIDWWMFNKFQGSLVSGIWVMRACFIGKDMIHLSFRFYHRRLMGVANNGHGSWDSH